MHLDHPKFVVCESVGVHECVHNGAGMHSVLRTIAFMYIFKVRNDQSTNADADDSLARYIRRLYMNMKLLDFTITPRPTTICA